MIFILTGAGISKESGIDTFRDAGGLWERVRIEDVATPGAFKRNPGAVYEFYDQRRRQLGGVSPNAAHLALARLEAAGIPVSLVTQNVDDLHERAGSRAVIHMHGELRSALCLGCRNSLPWPGDLGPADRCPACGGALRPDIVWFGETPYHLDEIERAIGRARTFVSIGTSGVVYPAAGLVRMAKAMGAKTVELNLEPSANQGAFDEGFYGLAATVVPAWVESVLAKSGRSWKG